MISALASLLLHPKLNLATVRLPSHTWSGTLPTPPPSPHRAKPEPSAAWPGLEKSSSDA